MAGISSKSAGKLDNRKKFNAGTELNTDFDINLYETNFRSLDPQVGRFWQIDPYSDIIVELSPYNFASNNPISRNDPLGLKDSIYRKELPAVLITGKRSMNVPSSFLPYIGFANGRPYSVASLNEWPLSFSRNRSNDLLDSWEKGLGAENRLYLPHHSMTRRLKNAWQVHNARVAFYKKYLTDYKNGKSLKGGSLPGYEGTFGLGGIILAGTDLVEQFVGGFLLDIRVDEKGENLLFILQNTTGIRSASYHRNADIERDPNAEFTPEGNLNQIYIWKEPINSKQFYYIEHEDDFGKSRIVK